MRAILFWIWKGLKRLAALTFPMFAKARDLRHPGSAGHWIVRLLVLAVILVGLGFLNVWLDLEKYVRAPLPILRKVWLPLVFLLAYVLMDLSWWLWRQLHAESEASEFPDIDAAWAEAMRNLDQAGIDLTETPVFLILGEPRGSGQALFGAAHLPLLVSFAPRQPDAPLHLYADRDGIYVTCPGASLLGRQASLLNADRWLSPVASPSIAVERSAPLGPALSHGELGEAESLRQDLLIGPGEKTGQTVPAQESKPGVGSALLPATIAPQGADTARRAARRRPVLDLNSEEARLLTDRLAHLCRLIDRDRRPYCPINGILLLIPFAATAGDEDAHQTGAVCRRDLSAARRVLKIHCPTFVMVCDLEEAPGFHEFVESFPEEQRLRFLGQHLPLSPAIEPSEVPRMIQGALRWIGRALFPALVYRLWQLEAPARDQMTDGSSRNIRLYQLLRAIHGRHERLYRIIYQALLHEARGPILLGGCYLAGTGREAARDKAFVAGVFRRLIENQNYVSWTEDALIEEANNRRWARYGLVAIVGYLSGLSVLVYVLWHG